MVSFSFPCSKLHEAKTRLHQLQQLLTTVVDIQNRGQPVPQHYLDQLAQETSSDDGSGRIIISSDDRYFELKNLEHASQTYIFTIPLIYKVCLKSSVNGQNYVPAHTH